MEAGSRGGGGGVGLSSQRMREVCVEVGDSLSTERR